MGKKPLTFDLDSEGDDNYRPHAPGELADGSIMAGSDDEMRPRLLLWQAQQAALERGEDPKLVAAMDEGDFEDVSDLYDYDDL